MHDLDIRIDTELRDRAVRAAEEFTRTNGHPVRRTQIAGLMQIASNQPDKISKFAGNHKQRADKRLLELEERARRRELSEKDLASQARLASEVEFWKLVTHLSAGAGGNIPWSLAQECEKEMPAHLKNLVKPHPSDKSGRETYNRLTAERRSREQQWYRDHYPGFFRHFCAEYCYRMPPEKEESQ